MLAGLKVGAAVALGCGVIGYAIGKVTKKKHSSSSEENASVSKENSESLSLEVEAVDKKDI